MMYQMRMYAMQCIVSQAVMHKMLSKQRGQQTNLRVITVIVLCQVNQALVLHVDAFCTTVGITGPSDPIRLF